MGIKDLYKIIKETSGFCVHDISEFSGYRFSLDISVFLYRYIRTAGPVRWMNSFILLLCVLKKNGIKPICIFDGPNPPIEKKGEQERRRSENKKALDRLSSARIMKKHLMSDYSIIDDPPTKETFDECQKIVGRREIDRNGIVDALEALSALIERLENQTLPITTDYRDKAVEIVQMMGFKAIVADGEAETLCSYLAVKKIVDAVLTEDTDVLAYGCPIMVAFKDFKLGDDKLYAIHYDVMIEDLGLNKKQFTDLCILLSCDYNSRVRGYPPDGKKRKKSVGIGVKGALCMIQEYGDLESITEYVDDISPLKYERCRELFSIPESVEDDVLPINIKPDYDSLQKLIVENNLTLDINYIKSCYKPTLLIIN